MNVGVKESGNLYVLREIVDEEEIDEEKLIDRIQNWDVVYRGNGSKAVLDRLEKNGMITKIDNKYQATGKGITQLEDIRHLLTRDFEKEEEERKKKIEERKKKREEEERKKEKETKDANLDV